MVAVTSPHKRMTRKKQKPRVAFNSATLCAKPNQPYKQAGQPGSIFV